METAPNVPALLRSLTEAAEAPPANREPHIPALRDYLAHTPSKDPNRQAALALICEVMEFKFSQKQSLENADASVRANEGLLDFLRSTPAVDMNAVSQAHNNLSVALAQRQGLAENQYKLDDLQAAINHARDAASIASRCGNPEQPEYLMQLGNLLRTSSGSPKSPSRCRDIEEAVSLLKSAIDLAGEDYPGLDAFWDRYGLALQQKYELLDDNEALKLAIEAHGGAAKQAARAVDKGRCLSNLANARLRLFDHCGSVDDEELGRAVKESKEAVHLTPTDHHDCPGRLINFANALQVQYERTGKGEYMHKAVDANRKALSAAQSILPGTLDHAECFASLGMVLNRLFDSTRSMLHLRDAIAAQKSALEILPEMDGNRGTYFYALGSSLTELFRNSQEDDDFESALQALKDAIDHTASDHKNVLTYKTTLANLYGAKFQFGNKLPDLNECIRLNREVVDESKRRDIHQFRASYLANYSNALFRRWRAREKDSTNDISDLNDAIDAQQEALDSQFAAADHPLRAPCLHNLGLLLADRYVAQRKREDRIKAIEAHIEASRMTTALPFQRIRAARRAMHLIQFGNLDLSTDVIREAIETLQFASPVTLNRSDQQRELADFAGLASRAVALNLEAGRSAYGALRLLELGRGVMATLQLGLRRDIERIADVDKNLAQKFLELRDELNTAPSSLLESVPTWEGAARPSRRRDNKHAIWDELNEVVANIRSKTGLEDFMDALPENEMMELARQGPIVVFNVDSIRSDAILVTEEGIRKTCLIGLRLADVQRYAKLVRELTESPDARKLYVGGSEKARPVAQSIDSLNQVLEWLWNSAVCPVLTELKVVQPLGVPNPDSSTANNHPKKTQRIWWVTSGWLSMLPIHAAGVHRHGATTNALDLVISSYVPTVKSLWYARRTAKSLSAPPQKALLLSAMDAPGQPRLPGAEIEIKRLDKIIPSKINRIISMQPTRQKTMSDIQECQICHFACHGESHAIDPSSSRLILSDAETPLTVGDVAALDLSGAYLAYLSACSAADSRVGNLLDESLHLSAAFLLAGFPAVVGTLWCIRDLKSAKVAEDFYGVLLAGKNDNGNDSGMDVYGTAEALNVAVKRLRKAIGSDGTAAAIWAPYIHFGV
jgi:hypothetical protein